MEEESTLTRGIVEVEQSSGKYVSQSYTLEITSCKKVGPYLRGSRRPNDAHTEAIPILEGPLSEYLCQHTWLMQPNKPVAVLDSL